MTDCFVFSIRNCGHWVIFISCEETRPRKHVPQIPRAPSCGRNRREKWVRRVKSAAESGRHLSRALNSINKRPSELTSGWKYRMTKKRKSVVRRDARCETNSSSFLAQQTKGERRSSLFGISHSLFFSIPSFFKLLEMNRRRSSSHAAAQTAAAVYGRFMREWLYDDDEGLCRRKPDRFLKVDVIIVVIPTGPTRSNQCCSFSLPRPLCQRRPKRRTTNVMPKDT